MSIKSWRLIAKFSTIYLCNGMGAGLIVPLFSLWFYLRFNVDIITVGYIFTASKATESFTYLLGPIIAPKFGLVNTIVTTRMGGALFAAILPFASDPISATLLYIGRNAVQHISLPLRQSFMMTVLQPEERASAAGIVQFSSTATRSLAPTLGGYLMEEVSTALPLFLSAAIFALGNSLYYVFFKHLEPSEEK